MKPVGINCKRLGSPRFELLLLSKVFLDNTWICYAYSPAPKHLPGALGGFSKILRVEGDKILPRAIKNIQTWLSEELHLHWNEILGMPVLQEQSFTHKINTTVHMFPHFPWKSST